MLKIARLHTYYGGIHALKGVNLELEQGEIVTLIGANGAGKSTTLMSICGIVPPRSGEILFEGRSIGHMHPDRIVALGIVQVPEGRRIFPELTVLENLDMGAFLRRDKPGIRRDIAYIFDLFPRLAERRNQTGGTLSGGEQQMLAISRGLMAKPRLLLLDEPSLGLAPLIIRDIFDIIDRLRHAGNTILIVEQNAFQTLKIADYAYVLELGRVSMQGKASQLIHDEALVEAYLGGQRA